MVGSSYKLEPAVKTYTELTKTERRQTRISWKLGAKVAGRELLPI